MAERKGIDPTILEFLTASGSNFDLLGGESSEDTANSWKRVERRARFFVEQHGHHGGSLSLAIKELINRTRIPTALECDLDLLTQTAGRIPMRIATFRYGEIPLSLMVTDPSNERIIFAERGSPDTRLVSGSPFTVRAEWAQSRLLFGIGALEDPGDNFKLGIPPVKGEAISHPMIACVKTILTLGEKHFATQQYVGHS